MTSRPIPQCATCEHLLVDPEQTCAAFPKGIPDEIWWNRADHRKPHAGDNGVRWKPLGRAKFPDYAMANVEARLRLPVRNIDPTAVNLDAVQRDFERRLNRLLDEWVSITADQRNQILDQIRAAVTSDDLAALARISVSTTAAAEALTEAMAGMALDAARRMSDEAMAQDVRIDPVASDTAVFAALAVTVAALLGQGLTNAAGREALRRWSPTTTGDEVAAAVGEHLESLSDAFVEAQLTGALTSAQNTGRMNTALSGPTAALYASEQMDARTCPPCSKINGKWIGNTDEVDIVAKVEAVYPNGGFRDCEGGVRCRGTVVSIYRPETVTSTTAE